ncbi:ArsR family transcriptional regulator [Endozoicomonas montiporae]|uniref:ArsR family transcriptional regulator n=1 Tax=Endozoicomonas montiporae TaxID=1027273 RepID=A0A081N5H3_9GAMM|nr:ArsR family transcriptional regulator [Endozoicomonas montiporae]
MDHLRFDEATEKELAGFAKAIAHPARVRLLKILASGGCLGTDLVKQLGLAQSTVSEHLRILKQAGLVDAEVQHPRTCFSLQPEALARLNNLLGYLA